jgi:hypothetical protein
MLPNSSRLCRISLRTASASCSRIMDDIPGLQDLECRPGEVYPECDEAEFAKHPPQS